MCCCCCCCCQFSHLSRHFVLFIRLERAWAKNGSSPDNLSLYKHGQADGSSIQTSYRDSPSCQTNYHGELVKTDDLSLCINAGRRRTIHKNYTSLQEASCCFPSHDTPIVRLIVRPVFILDGWSVWTDDPSPVYIGPLSVQILTKLHPYLQTKRT